LKHEYGVNARLAPARHKYARWITSDDERELKRFIDNMAHRIAYDVVEAPTFLAGHATELTAAADNWPKVRFHALREHAGLVFQSQ
jgi:peptide chain release factor 3